MLTGYGCHARGRWLLLSLFLCCMPTQFSRPKGRLLAIGGHEQRDASDQKSVNSETSPDFILQRFVEELKGSRTVVVLPTAS
ncbi:hypothetical protein ACC848_37945, partial [Rhizobium johnstonii]